MATDESPPEVSERPWEDGEAVRRDCEPHRGDFLCFIAASNLALCVFSCPFVPIAVISLPAGLLVSFLARRDLGRMRRKEMDPAGKVKTFHALEAGLTSAIVSLFGLVMWAVLFFFVLRRF